MIIDDAIFIFAEYLLGFLTEHVKIENSKLALLPSLLLIDFNSNIPSEKVIIEPKL